MLNDAEELATSAKKLQGQLSDRMEKLRARAVTRNSELSLNAPKLLLHKKKQDKYSKEDLFQIVKNIHSELWLNREQIWSAHDQLHPVQMINPATTFGLHGYDYEETVSLGQDSIDGELVEIAGYVDNEEKVAKVSRKFSPDVRRFTSAHELGHAILHKQKKMFRDRALDGGAIGSGRPQIEREADAFAVLFLMPEVQVRDIFEQIFGQEQFNVDQRSAFALGFRGVGAMQTKLPTDRHLSVRLATTDLYSGIPKRSLCGIFGVSPTAMAIRIEELSLIQSL